MSWRKAIVSMIPKKKEDGSFTSLVTEMRPISVLQEFGKIASKILANRMGIILLKHPQVMNRAQRAFLRDGCTAQCINVALNVLEDFQEKKRKYSKAQLFLLAYDQVKAYDSVQAYSIRASLERFNLPESFIEYVLSNLDAATSCFKPFMGQHLRLLLKLRYVKEILYPLLCISVSQTPCMKAFGAILCIKERQDTNSRMILPS